MRSKCNVKSEKYFIGYWIQITNVIVYRLLFLIINNKWSVWDGASWTNYLFPLGINRLKLLLVMYLFYVRYMLFFHLK